jgi:hypothetical protein
LEEPLKIRTEKIRLDTGQKWTLPLLSSGLRWQRCKGLGVGGRLRKGAKNQDARREDRMNPPMTLPGEKTFNKKNKKSWPKRHAECDPKHGNDPELIATLMLHDRT